MLPLTDKQLAEAQAWRHNPVSARPVDASAFDRVRSWFQTGWARDRLLELHDTAERRFVLSVTADTLAAASWDELLAGEQVLAKASASLTSGVIAVRGAEAGLAFLLDAGTRDISEWSWLRHAVARADEATYARLQAAAEERLATAVLAEAYRLAYAFPHLPWGAELLADYEAKSRHGFSRWHLWQVLQITSDVDALRPFVDRFPADRWAKALPTLVVGLAEPDVVSLLGDLLDTKTQADKSTRQLFARLLSRSSLEAASARLAPHVGDRAVGKLVTEHFVRHPERASLLTGAKGAALAARLRPREDVGPTAPTEALPVLLRDRTWRPRKGGRALSLPTLAVEDVFRRDPAAPPPEPAVPMTEAEVAHWRKKGHYVDRDWRRLGAGRVERTTPPVDEGIALWNTGERWAWPEATWAAEHGLRVLEGFLHRARGGRVGAGTYEALAMYGATRACPIWANVFARRRGLRPLALRWGETFPEHAAAGLVPAALGPKGATRTQAFRFLYVLASRGARDAILTTAARFGDVAHDRLRDELDLPATLPGKPPAIPDFLMADTLPRLRLTDGRALSGDDQTALLELLAKRPVEEVLPGLETLAAAFDPASLDAFHHELVARWRGADAPARHDWVLWSVAALPSPGGVRAVGAFARAAAVAKKTLASRSLPVLATLGDDLSLMHLGHIQATTRYTNVRREADALLDEVAAVRGLTRDALADRTVPDLGLGPEGLVVDYGGRTFRLSVSGELELQVHDADGTLPPKRKTDDPDLVRNAKATHKSLRKHLDAVARHQTRRLERAMVSGRSWTLDDARRLFWDQPLLRNASRGLVWLADVAFRIDETGELVDLDDEPVSPQGPVHIAHPIQVDAAAWADVLTDYEFVQPFEQLSRSVHVLSPDGAAAEDLGALAGDARLAPRKILGWTDARGWRRGAGDWIQTFERAARATDGAELVLTLALEDGFELRYLAEGGDPIGIASVCLSEGDEAVPFSRLSAVDQSELLRELADFAAR